MKKGFSPMKDHKESRHILVRYVQMHILIPDQAVLGRGQTFGNHLESIPAYGHPSSDAAR